MIKSNNHIKKMKRKNKKKLGEEKKTLGCSSGGKDEWVCERKQKLQIQKECTPQRD